MYESTRSYLSRFSGVILFVLALIVVGVLIFLTVRSAQDDDNTSQETAAVVASEDESAVFGTIDSETGVVSADGVVVASQGTTEVVVSDGQTGTLESSTGNGEALPNNEALPNTGLAEMAGLTLGLVALTLAGLGFINSRRNLNNELLNF